MNGARSTYMRRGYLLTALAAVVLLAASTTALAQVTVKGPASNTVTEGDVATYTVSVKGFIPASTASPTDAEVSLGTLTGEAAGTATSGEAGDLSTADQNSRSVTFDLPPNNTAAAVAFSATGTITIQTLHDGDAENERFTFTPTLTAGDLDSDADGTEATLAAGAPTMLIIDDDETQTYTLTLDQGQTPAENGTAALTLKAVPPHAEGATALTVNVSDAVNYSWDNNTDSADTRPAAITIGATGAGGVATSPIIITAPMNDKNRETDSIDVTVHSGQPGRAKLEASTPVTFTDLHTLAPGTSVTAVAMDKKTGGEKVDSVVEGGDPVYLTITVDRGRKPTRTTPRSRSSRST